MCDTSFLVNEILKVLNNLKKYNLHVVKIFLDSMKESEKMNTLLERRADNIKSEKAFWESDLLLKSVPSFFLSSSRWHKNNIFLP